jgi:hypothetical protein
MVLDLPNIRKSQLRKIESGMWFSVLTYHVFFRIKHWPLVYD